MTEILDFKSLYAFQAMVDFASRTIELLLSFWQQIQKSPEEVFWQ